MNYQELLNELQKMTTKQLSKQVKLYDVNNDETRDIDEISIAGKEDAQDCRPSRDDVPRNSPYLVVY